ncbi:outer membrane protein assembly factor BamA [Desulfoluna sp.]|uniref:outer membrane protein assembly factor BamA n=1 Tax=Desulfoluna sp. TaxID=2045199 RepID=UPI00262E811D|nr:outer membrane protein assembly factor BamA [Desulfoluna sp.]
MAVIFIVMMFLGALAPHPVRASSPEFNAAPLVSKISVEIIGPMIPSYRRVAQAMILLREGEPFSDDDFQKSLNLLKSSRLFQGIDVPDPDWEQPEIALTFRLTPFQRIKDIRIHGAFPLLQKEVLNAMTLFTGDAYVAEDLKKQEALIQQVFKHEGYPDARIRVSAQKDPKEGHYNVSVVIDKGPFDRIRNVEMTGNKAFSSARLKLRIDSWKASLFFGEIPRFIEKKFKADLKNLTKFYRHKGYAEVKITPVVNRVPDSHDVNLQFLIHEGPQYKMTFEGNQEFWDFTLKKELVLKREGNKNDLGLKKSIRNIRKRYRKAGYLDARVRMTESAGNPDEAFSRKIRLTVDEGVRSLVHTLTITGNSVLDRERLKKQILTRPPSTFDAGAFVPEILEDDISAIQSLYLRQGYLNTAITDEVRWNEDKKKGQRLADVSLIIHEGKQTRVDTVTFRGLGTLTDAEARTAIALKEGKPFREYMIESDENTLSELISEKGYPHVTVKGQAVMDETGTGPHRASLTYALEDGPHVSTGALFYTGNFRTRAKILQREVALTPGMPFSLTKALKTQRNIRNISALSSAKFRTIGLKEKAPRVNLLVEVEEKKPYYLEFGAGYDTRRKKYAHTRLGDHNLLGLNKDGWVSAETSEIGYRTELGITEPRFFGTRIASTISMFGEDLHEFNQDFGTRTYGASLAFNRQFLEKFNASLTHRYEFREQYQAGSAPIDPADADQYDPRSIVVVTPALTYNSTDSFVRPRQGGTTRFSVDISRGIENSLDDFFKQRAELRYYLTPLNRLTFALRGRIHHMEPYGSNNAIPEDQLLFLGGTSDIRGFGENKLLTDATDNPVGGHTAILGSLEARFDLGMNFEFTTFYDTGCIRNASEPDLSESFRSSAGVGLRYITPIGPIGFLYGWKLAPKPEESAGNLHFSIGYTF